MITSKLAELKAIELLKQYIITCECETIEDSGNALMKLISVASCSLICAEGQFTAVTRMQSVVNNMARAKFSTPPLPIDEQQPKSTISIH